MSFLYHTPFLLLSSNCDLFLGISVTSHGILYVCVSVPLSYKNSVISDQNSPLVLPHFSNDTVFKKGPILKTEFHLLQVCQRIFCGRSARAQMAAQLRAHFLLSDGALMLGCIQGLPNSEPHSVFLRLSSLVRYCACSFLIFKEMRYHMSLSESLLFHT